jgi:hypothetical protein
LIMRSRNLKETTMYCIWIMPYCCTLYRLLNRVAITHVYIPKFMNK